MEHLKGCAVLKDVPTTTSGGSASSVNSELLSVTVTEINASTADICIYFTEGESKVRHRLVITDTCRSSKHRMDTLKRLLENR